METNNLITKIRQELKNNKDEKTQKTSQNFFKEEIKCYGIRSAIVSKIGKDHFKFIENKEKNNIFSLCEQLWQSGYIEESFIACNWSYFVHKEYMPDDIAVFEKWINQYVTNWASCDTLCNHTVGEFIEMYPEYIVELKKWAKSTNRWMRRAASVSLIVPARKGKFLPELFEIADILLPDKDDLVQKGYGWMLKAASKNHQKEVLDYVVSKKHIMPRTALRYAIEKMPQDLKVKAMSK